MVYHGLSRIGGVTWVNYEQLGAYAANGLVSPDVSLQCLTDDRCTGLAAIVVGDGPYRTPMQDEPPWYDVDTPDTFDFAGVMPLEITGADDSTRTVEMVPLLGDGGSAGRPRRAPRTVGVTAMLLGASTEGVLAGYEWLTRLLHRTCDDTNPCATGQRLELLTMCPGPIEPVADLDADRVTVRTASLDDGGAAEDWLVIGGTFPSQTDEDGLPVGHILCPYDEDSGGPHTNDGGLVMLVGQPHEGSDGPVTIQWRLYGQGSPGNTTVHMVLVDNTGTIILDGPYRNILTLGDPEFGSGLRTWEIPEGVCPDNFRPAIIVQRCIRVRWVDVIAHPTIAPADCIAPYRRTLPGAVCTSGPTIVETTDVGCAEFLTVEWVWELTSPYRYGDTKTLLLGLNSDDDPELVATGVSYEQIHDSSTATAEPDQYCPTPPAAAANCAVDPTTPGYGTAPALPVITSTTTVDIDDTDTVRSFTVLLDPSVIPGGDGVFTLALTAQTGPVVGVRVRVWDDADGTGAVPSECDFAYEYLVDFIPDDGVLTIGGPDELVHTLCDGATTYGDARPMVRGSYGGPILQPHARCNRRYLIRVDQLDKYPRTAPGVYVSGQEQALVALDVYVSGRDG